MASGKPRGVTNTSAFLRKLLEFEAHHFTVLGTKIADLTTGAEKSLAISTSGAFMSRVSDSPHGKHSNRHQRKR